MLLINITLFVLHCFVSFPTFKFLSSRFVRSSRIFHNKLWLFLNPMELFPTFRRKWTQGNLGTNALICLCNRQDRPLRACVRDPSRSPQDVLPVGLLLSTIRSTSFRCKVFQSRHVNDTSGGAQVNLCKQRQAVKSPKFFEHLSGF